MIWEHREGQSTNHTTGKSITCVALNVGAISCPVMDFRFQVADPTSVDGFVIAATGGRFTRGENEQETSHSDVYCVHNGTGYIRLRLASLFNRDGDGSYLCVGDEGCPQRQLPTTQMEDKMRLLSKLMNRPRGLTPTELIALALVAVAALVIFGVLFGRV